MNNGIQNWMAEKIDRSGEQTARAKLKPARAMQIRMDARIDFRQNLARYETSADRAAYQENLLDMVAETLPRDINRVDAMTAFNKRAADIGVSLKLTAATARATAEQVYDRLIRRPANEDHANDDRGDR